jgi:hypothetical protein
MFDEVVSNNFSGQALLKKYGFKLKEQTATSSIFFFIKSGL